MCTVPMWGTWLNLDMLLNMAKECNQVSVSKFRSCNTHHRVLQFHNHVQHAQCVGRWENGMKKGGEREREEGGE